MTLTGSLTLPETQAVAGVVETDHTNRLLWVEYVKAIGLVWIFLVHFAESVFGSPYIANPSALWPSLGARITQLLPFQGYGVFDIPLNILRYVGWAGDQGVQLFLIVSGFGLTWGLLSRQPQAPLALRSFYLRRLGRIYPLWWAAHIFFLIGAIFINGLSISASDPSFLFSFLGIRVTANQIYYFAPAWWYVGLLLQLYLVYPLLWAGMRRWGPLRLLVICLAAAFIIRGAGLLLFDTYLDAWSRGAIFITRMPEFVFGMALAGWMHQEFKETDRRLRARSTLLAAAGIYAVATVMSLSLLGMTFAPFLVGFSAFVLVYAFLNRKGTPAGRKHGPWVWIGEHSYALFLVHHPLILLFVPNRSGDGRQVLIGFVEAVILTLVTAVFLEKAVAITQTTLKRWGQYGSFVGVALRLAALIGLLAAIIFGANQVVKRFWPQEVLGWGERPALQPHPVFGWNLIPTTETRLRWANYDYVVSANELGFPGPAYSPIKPPQTVRVMVVGDAFSSAEGVDTRQAWPRLLEADLAALLPNNRIEVMNFAITGYGPNQYAAVIETFAEQYQPDWIIVEAFVNDFGDVLATDDAFRENIGFGLPPGDSLYADIRLLHLRRFITLQLTEPIKELLRSKPNPEGYILAHFRFLEKDNPELDQAFEPMQQRYSQIKRAADAAGARLLVMMAPSSAQVCAPDQLPYYPRHVNLNDTTRFDLDEPQRLVEQIAISLAVPFLDLRPLLSEVHDGCPYQPYNMHWLPDGHAAVAQYMAEWLAADESNRAAAAR